MKKIYTMVSLLALLLLAATPASAQSVPDREMRSAWVATVWRLDWPQTVISSTGNTSQIEKQKQQMITLLDSLEINNFNAVNFQVRSRCDAMYRSSFEPWSSDLVDTRGKDPGWDPLEFVVQECHKRGLECHAWLNPYRFESVKGQWTGLPGDYRDTNPDWVMDVTNSSGTTASILNPGLPEVTQRICDIIDEIVTNYDIDGVLFDDYFYLSGTNTSHDGNLYDAYKNAGGNLSIGDWRRDNVNRMIASVYSTIKEAKPWVRFGVSPAGIACTDANVARKYGIPRCPTGSDWQYNDIYSDPIAWVSQQSLDYISPQIYWTIGNSTHYDLATEWWSMVANKWNRHLYVSHSISSLTAQSKSPAESTVEAQTMAARPDYASGPGATTFQEYVDQIYLNREFNLDNAPGSIFYSCKYIYRTAPLFGHYLLNKAFTTRCLLPAMPWMGAHTPSPVENLTLAGSRLSWTPKEGMRYTVYAFPANLPDNEKLRKPEYLLGVSYSTEYTLDSKYLSGYTFGVCAYDRYGNESSIAIPGAALGKIDAPVLMTPTAEAVVEAPFSFAWQPVANAAEYIVEVSETADFNRTIDQRSTSETSLSSTAMTLLPLEKTLYWRVRACAAGYSEGVSSTGAFKVVQMRIAAPTHSTTTTSLTPVFEYTIDNREVTLQIAADSEFTDIVYTSVHTGSHKVADYALSGLAHYYARALYKRGDDELVTPAIEFYTPVVQPVVPAIAFPVAGGDFHADQHITLEGIAGPSILRVEVSADKSFPARQIYQNAKVGLSDMTDPKSGAEIRISGKSLVDGSTYWCRARATFRAYDEHGDISAVNTEYSAPVPFIYRASTSGVENITVENTWIKADGNSIVATADITDAEVSAISGIVVARAAQAAAGTVLVRGLEPGVYIVAANGHEPIKLTIR